MNITAILLTAACLQVSAKGWSQEITLSLNKVPMQEAFTEIERQTGYNFLCDYRILQHAGEVSVSLKNVSLRAALKACLKGKDLTYTIIEKTVVIKYDAPPEKPDEAAPAPAITVTGRVTDQNGNPVIGASVGIKGTTNGTVTDANGQFVLQNVAADAVLVVSSINYETQEVSVNGRTALQVKLAEKINKLNEVVAIGYGVESKRNITGSIQNLEMDGLKDLPVAQLSQKLQGQLAGVQIAENSGQLGGGMNVNIRGQASLTAGAQPLYVVDGMPIVGDISDLDPNAIESISVLKDASAAALYGSRAANGVVLIETKRSTPGKTQLNFNAYYGLQHVPQKGRPKMMTAREFAEFRKEIAEVNGTPVDPAYANPDQYGKGTDWYNLLLQRAPIQDYSLSLNTGTEKINTMIIADYLNQDGIVLNSRYKRYSVRINTDFRPTDRLEVGLNVAPNYIVQSGPNTEGTWLYGAVISEATLASPVAKAYNEDGSLTYTATSPGLFNNPNWIRVAEERENDTRHFRLLSNGFLKYQLIDGLYFKTSLNVDLGQSRHMQFSPSTTFYPSRNATGSLANDHYLSWLNENTFTYDKIWGDHSLEALVGFTAQQYQEQSSNINGSEYPDDKIRTITAAGQITASSDVQEWKLLSYLARLNYSYKNKYLASASIRSDGSSRFGPDNRWGVFPSLSLGWIVSEENFMKAVTPISFLKLRGSYGVVGNFNIGNYTYFSNITTTNYIFPDGLAAGRSVTNLGNPTLGWETNKELDLGLDIHLLKDRIQLTYDYYRKITTGLLYNVEVPQASGFSNFQANIGKLKFWGHEFSVKAYDINNKNFTWITNFNISFNRDKALELGTQNAALFTGEELTSNYITEVGQPVGMFYGMVHEGVYVNQEDFDNSPKNTASQVGTVKFKDVNGDGVITQDDRQIIGNPHPDFTFGLTNTFRVKHFDATIVMAGSYGNKIARLSEQFTANLDGVFNVLEEVKDHWRSPENPGSGKYGSLVAGTTNLERDWFSNRFIYDGSYLGVKNISLGYTIPLKQSSRITKLRVYGSVQHAFLFTGYPGNPEVNVTRSGSVSTNAIALGSDYSAYPIPRTITLGVNMTL